MEKHKKFKTIILLIFLGLISTVIGVLIVIEEPEVKQALRYHFAWTNPSKTSVENYLEASTSDGFKNYLQSFSEEDLGTPVSYTVNDLYDWLTAVESKTGRKLKALQSVSYTVHHLIPNTTMEELDENYPQNMSYLASGSFGKEIYTFDVLENSAGETKKYNYVYQKVDSVENILFTGTLEQNEVATNVQVKFSDVLQNLEASVEPEVLQNLVFSKVDLQQIKKFRAEENQILKIGEVVITMNNCNRENTLQLGYDPVNKDYVLQEVEAFTSRLCKRQYVETNGYLVGTCTDCTLYPADKSHALRSDYVPDVRLLDFAPGGQSIYVKAYDDFKELYQAAASAGYYIFVTSGYRSYATQQNTFESWVAYEMAMGKTRAAAEAAANTYSARPGFSEHQLGTALDLNSGGCGLASGCSGNQGVWNWLRDNAHIYGFVNSYPSNKVNDTGYIYEPWHYRWIGRELAAKYKSVEGTTWLAEFLRNENQF